jgi:hypothetical protein
LPGYPLNIVRAFQQASPNKGGGRYHSGAKASSHTRGGGSEETLPRRTSIFLLPTSKISGALKEGKNGDKSTKYSESERNALKTADSMIKHIFKCNSLYIIYIHTICIYICYIIHM